MARRWWRVSILVVSWGAVGCSGPDSKPAPTGPIAVEVGGMQNVFRLNDRLYSGSAPETDADFAALAQLGVKTVITVDGTTPDVATAGRHGLRYVHVPVGYDGIPREKAWRIAKAARDLPGPVYVHCHHGQHRGPAAAACVLLALDPSYTRDDVAAWLTQVGTDPRYHGLIELPRTLPRPEAADLDAVPADFPSVAKIADLTRLMVEVDARNDHLKAAKAAGWKVTPDHPDIDPPHEALQLRELFSEAGRTSDAGRHGAEFLALLKEAKADAAALENALRAGDGTAQAAFARSQTLCAKCHAKYRN